MAESSKKRKGSSASALASRAHRSGATSASTTPIPPSLSSSPVFSSDEQHKRYSNLFSSRSIITVNKIVYMTQRDNLALKWLSTWSSLIVNIGSYLSYNIFFFTFRLPTPSTNASFKNENTKFSPQKYKKYVHSRLWLIIIIWKKIIMIGTNFFNKLVN